MEELVSRTCRTAHLCCALEMTICLTTHCTSPSHNAPTVRGTRNKFARRQTVAMASPPRARRQPYRLGLTGSIGMGKSTVAQMFREASVPVMDADEAVHALYQPGGGAVEPIRKRFPGVVTEEGGVSRPLLSKEVVGNEAAMRDLEAIVHPLVVAHREAVLAGLPPGQALVVFDIPLLFETGGREAVDAVLVVSAPAEVQRQRVLARDNMTPEKFEAILVRQTPDEEKRKQADHIIFTDTSLTETRKKVDELIIEVTGS